MSKFTSARSAMVAAGLLVACGLSSTASATVTQYSAVLNGISEAPPNGSPGTGFATAAYDDLAHTLALNVTFSGLIGNTTASHIHGATALPGVGTAGVATTTPTFAGFPLGVTSGTYSIVLNLTLASSYNPSYVTANGGTTASAELALTNAIASGRAYLNIHSSFVPSGEIRGFWQPVPAPGAATAVLGAGVLFSMRRRRN